MTWVEIGSGSESLDIDEFRIATTFFEAAPVARPTLAAVQTNQKVRVKLSGLPSRNYGIEGSTNLLGWLSFTNGLSDTNGLLQFDDTNYLASPWRFYRGVFP